MPSSFCNVLSFFLALLCRGDSLVVLCIGWFMSFCGLLVTSRFSVSGGGLCLENFFVLLVLAEVYLCV